MKKGNELRQVFQHVTLNCSFKVYNIVMYKKALSYGVRKERVIG